MNQVPNNLDDYGFLTIDKDFAHKKREMVGLRSLDDILQSSRMLCSREEDNTSYDKSSLYTLQRVEDEANQACSRNKLIESHPQLQTSDADTPGNRRIRVKFAISDEILNKISEEKLAGTNEIRKKNVCEVTKQPFTKERITKQSKKIGQKRGARVQASRSEVKPQSPHVKSSWWKKIFTRTQKKVYKDEALTDKCKSLGCNISNSKTPVLQTNRNDATSAGFKPPDSQVKKKDNSVDLSTSTKQNTPVRLFSLEGNKSARLLTKGGSVDCLLQTQDNKCPIRQFQSSPVRRHHSSLNLSKRTMDGKDIRNSTSENDNNCSDYGFSFFRDNKYRHTIQHKNNSKEMLTALDAGNYKVPHRYKDTSLDDQVTQAWQNSSQASEKVKTKSKRMRLSFSFGSKTSKKDESSNTSDSSKLSSFKESITEENIHKGEDYENSRRNEDKPRNSRREETFVKTPFPSDGIVPNLYEKYPANKEAKQRRVLVHIHTKEEVPIENGIPQWDALSYQCVSAALHQKSELRKLLKDQHDGIQVKKISQPKLMESSFIGAFPATDSRNNEKYNHSNISGSSANESAVNTEISRKCIVVNAEVCSQVKQLMDREAIACNQETEKEHSSNSLKTEADTDNSQLDLSSKMENLQQSPTTINREPSYFEVNAEKKTEKSPRIQPETGERNDEVDSMNRLTGKAFAFTGMATDDIPDVIAKKHSYLTTSSTLRNMAKCLRQAPLSRTAIQQVIKEKNSDQKKYRNLVYAPKPKELLSRANDFQVTNFPRRCLSDTNLSMPSTPRKWLTLREFTSTPKEANKNDREVTRIRCRNDKTDRLLLRMKERIHRLEMISDSSQQFQTSRIPPPVGRQTKENNVKENNVEILNEREEDVATMPSRHLPNITSSLSGSMSELSKSSDFNMNKQKAWIMKLPNSGKKQLNYTLGKDISCDKRCRSSVSSEWQCFSEERKGVSTSVHSNKLHKVTNDSERINNSCLECPSTNVDPFDDHESSLHVSSHLPQFSIGASAPGQSPSCLSKHNSPTSPTRQRLRIMPFTLPFVGNRTKRPVVLPSVTLEKERLDEDQQTEGSQKFIKIVSSLQDENQPVDYIETAASEGDEDFDNECKMYKTATQPIDELFEPIFYTRETTKVTYSSASRPISTSSELRTSVCTDNMTNNEHLQYNTCKSLRQTTKPVLSVRDVAISHISKTEKTNEISEVNCSTTNLLIKDSEHITTFNNRDNCLITSKEESKMNGQEAEYWEENSEWDDDYEVNNEQVEESQQTNEEISKTDCTESLGREEQIKQMILKEMTLVKSRYKKSYKDGILESLNAVHGQSVTSKEWVPTEYCSSDAFSNTGYSKTNMNLKDVSFNSLSVNYGSFSEPHQHENSIDNSEGHTGQTSIEISNNYCNVNWPRYNGYETDL